MSADILTQGTCDCLQIMSAAYCKETQTAADFFLQVRVRSLRILVNAVKLYIQDAAQTV
jgi:hypothetical protein